MVGQFWGWSMLVLCDGDDGGDSCWPSGGRPFLFDTKQYANPSETTSYGRNKYFGQMPALGIFPVKGRIYQANQTLTLVLTPFGRVPHAWRTHTSTARYKQIPLEKSKTIDIDGSSTLQLVLIDSIIMLIPQKQAFQYNFFNSWLGFSSITMMEKRHRAISNFWLSAVEFTFRTTIMWALARQYYNIRKYDR